MWSLALVVLGLAVLGAGLAYMMGQRAAMSAAAVGSLAGLWTAPSDFCDSSGVSSLSLLIAKPGKRNKRIVLLQSRRPDGTLALDEFVSVVFTPHGRVQQWHVFKFVTSQAATFKNANVYVDFVHGKMRIVDPEQKVILADLARDAVASEPLEY